MMLIDKPVDWTSFDIVRKVRALFRVRKVGHAGSLDPRATGLLIVCTGKQTKTIDTFVNAEKEYTGSFRLGIRTPSFDLETEVMERIDPSGVSEQAVTETAASFLGHQLQKPPMYSAAKYGGTPLYRYARRGKIVEREDREITVARFDILSVEMPDVAFRIVCSKGTYIRSLVDAFGMKLGCGATLTELRRTRIGALQVRDAMTVEQLIEWQKKIVWNTRMLDEARTAH